MSEEEIFIEAVEIADPTRRQQFLETACAGDDSLRSSVAQLLSMHDTAGDFLENPLLERQSPGDTEAPGAMLGRYKLLEKIGEGGFGDVWKAEQQEPVKRLVALKVIKPGMDTRRVIARFEAERQVLALMSHRNIAAVLDAGSTQRGRPYFVMELVDGKSIDQFCDEARMPVPERLALFAQICRAVQHAHQKAIVHRDLKPSNILVAEGDTQPIAKIIDFGIAKAMETSSALDISATAPRQLMGTPEYMSPEQVAGENDIDTRADVYALGGVLYKLLVGVPPLDVAALRKSGLDTLTRAIREDDAPRPSTRILRVEDSRHIAELRDTQPAALSRQLRGDLDSIVTKALAKERSRRYESASDLARDIDRFLKCEPVSAAAPGYLYRATKFLRRHRVGVIATTLVAVGLIVGTIGLLSADRARRNEASLRRQADLKEQIANYQRQVAMEERKTAAFQRQLAEAKANEALRVASLLEGIVAAASPRGGKRADFTPRQQLDEFAASLGEELSDYPEIEARLRRTIGRAYLDLIEIKLAGPHLKRALELRLQLYGPDHALVLESRVDYAFHLISDSRMDQAEAELRQALPALRKSQPSAALVRALDGLAELRYMQEGYRAAQRLSREAWELSELVHGEQDAKTFEYQCKAANRASLAAQRVRDSEPQLREAETQLRDGLRQLETLWPDRQFEIDMAKGQLSRLLVHRGEIAEARQLVEGVLERRKDTLGRDSKHLISDMLLMSRIHIAEDDRAAAEAVVREAVAMSDRVHDERERIRGSVFHRLSGILDPIRPDEAVEWHKKAINAWHACLGNHPIVALQRRRLAEQLRSLGRWPEAEQALLQALEVLSHYPERDQPRGLTHHRIADLLRAADEPSRAVEHLHHAIELQDPGSIFALIARLDCIATLIELDELDQAEQVKDDCLDAGGQSESAAIKVASRLAEAHLLIARGEHKAARNLLNQLVKLFGKDAPRLKARAEALLARYHVRMREFEPAEKILLAQTTDKALRSHPLEPRRVARQLVELYQAWGRPDKAATWREP